MKKIYLMIAVILVMVTLSFYACSSTTTIIQQAPISTYKPPSTSMPINSPPSSTTLSSASNQVIKAQTADVLPSNGVYIQAGQTLTLSWSADGKLVGYIFTANQYNNWQNSLYTVATSVGYGSGSQGSIPVVIQNSDTYYAVLYNDAISVLGSGPSVEVYQFTVTEH